MAIGYLLLADVIIFEWAVFRLRMLEQGQTKPSIIAEYRKVIMRQPEAAIKVAVWEFEKGQLSGNSVHPIWIMETLQEEAIIGIRRRLAELDAKNPDCVQRCFNLECGLFAICGVEDALGLLIRDGQRLNLDTVSNRQMLELVEAQCRRIYPQNAAPLIVFEGGKSSFAPFWLDFAETILR